MKYNLKNCGTRQSGILSGIFSGRMSGFLWSVFFSLAWLFAVPPAMAEEKISVIGSHIKRIQAEGPSPMMVIDRHQIEASGHQTMADLLRDLPIFNGAEPGTALNSISSYTKAGMRGMDSSELLVLINKVRIVPAGGGNSVDLSVLPLVAIERIEILKDGSSALYGADAIGGVMNIVTRKNFKGIKASVQTSLTQREEGNSVAGFASFLNFVDWKAWQEGAANSHRELFSGKGDQFNLEAIYGGDKGSINYLWTGQLRVNTPLYFRDRVYGQIRPEHFSQRSSPGNWRSEGLKEWHAMPGCLNIHKTGMCTFDFGPYMQFTPQELHAKAFLYTTQPFNKGMLETQSLYSAVRTHDVVAPAPQFMTNELNKPDYRVPADVFNRLRAAVPATGHMPTATGPVSFYYRLVDETGAGSRESIGWNHFLQTHARYVQPLQNAWEMEANTSLSFNYYTRTGYKYFNKAILFESIKDGSFNFLLPKGQKNDISHAEYNPVTDIFSGMVNVEPRLSGELAEVKGQTISFATGMLGGWQYYINEADEISKAGHQWGGGVINTGSGGRLFGSVYGELSSVIASRLELQLATRTDYYEGFGLAWQEWTPPFTDTALPFPFSPKAAAIWQLINPLKLRASWGLGFKVPTLATLFQDETVGALNSRDVKLCDDTYYQTHKDSPECKDATQYTVRSIGNQNIGPELTQSINIGFVFEPVEQFSMTVDYFNFDQSGGTGGLGLRSLIEIEKKNGVAAVKAIGSDIKRGPDGRIEYAILAPVNSSRASTHGFDMDASLRLPVGKGWFMDLKEEYYHLIYQEVQATKDADIKTAVPFYGWMKDLFGFEDGEQGRKNTLTWPGTPRWRNRVTLSFDNKDMGQTYSMVVHNIPSQLQTIDSPDTEVIPYYWQLDLNAVWQLNNKTEVIVGVDNVLGFDRPMEPSPARGDGYLLSSLYSLRGRTINMRYTYRF